MQGRGWQVGAAALVAALVAGCGSESPEAVDEPPAEETPELEPEPAEEDVDEAHEDPEPVEPDDEATPEPDPQPADSPLAFSARNLEGGTVDLGTHAGAPVVLWMWAPW